MYLTAQKVVSDKEQAGINVFYHLHRLEKQPIVSSKLDVISVAESNAGELIKERCDINPGGNRVKSYLDIVAPNEIEVKQLGTALDEFRNDIISDNIGPIISIVRGIGFRFNADFGLYDTVIDEYDELKTRALSLLESK